MSASSLRFVITGASAGLGMARGFLARDQRVGLVARELLALELGQIAESIRTNVTSACLMIRGCRAALSAERRGPVDSRSPRHDLACDHSWKRPVDAPAEAIADGVQAPPRVDVSEIELRPAARPPALAS